MLQTIGDAFKGRKALSWLILVPLAIVFAMWGATGAVTFDFIGPKSYAAKVDGTSIPLEEASKRWQEQQTRWAQQFGIEMPESIKAQLQDELIEQLIRTELLNARTRDSGYRVDAGRLQQAISAEEAFQVDGKYSETLALARLAQVGLSAEQYRASVLRSLQGEELQRALFVSEFLTPTELGRRLALDDEQREVRYAVFSPKQYRPTVRLSDADVDAWYRKNSSKFLTPESVRLQFAEATEAGLAEGVVIAESDLLGLYAKNKDRYLLPERRRARHILVSTEREAQDALTQLKSGADFADLAGKISKDTGSASAGGDLGFSDRSAYVTPFADALFSMKEGELRGPVKTEFGYHLIRLEGIEAGRERAYAEVKSELQDQYRRDRVAELFSDKQELVQRRLELPGADLATIAKELGLRLGESTSFLRSGGSAELAANPDLEAVVFSDAVLNQRRIGGPVALGDDRFVIVKVLEHRKPVVPALADIRDRVVAAASAERATEEARQAADSVVKLMSEGAAFENMIRGLGVSPAPARFIDRRDPSIPAEIRAAAFELSRPVSGKPTVKSVSIADGGSAVVVVTAVRVVPAAGDVAVRAARGQQIATSQTQGVIAAFIEDIRKKADVTRNPQAFQ